MVDRTLSSRFTNGYFKQGNEYFYRQTTLIRHILLMKTAYERAMEKLAQADPKFAEKPVSGDQRERLAELDRLYAAKIAEREVLLEGQIGRARGVERQQLQTQLFRERERLEKERDAKKQAVRDDEGSVAA